MSSGRPRPFRFGVVVPILNGVPAWRDELRRIADLGYSTVLMPDVLQWQPAPAPVLAAATLTDLRVGTWVYAAPYRPARVLAWEAHSLSLLTEGRFEFGIGTGRPGMEDELRELGRPVNSPAERLAAVADAVRELRALDGSLHTPVTMAVRGPKAVALAAELADTITFAGSLEDTRSDYNARAARVRATSDAELALHVSVVGDMVAPFMSGPGTNPAALRATDSMLILPDDPSAAVDEIRRRREEGGFTYVVVGSNAADALAPAVAELAGQV